MEDMAISTEVSDKSDSLLGRIVANKESWLWRSAE